MLAKSPAGAVLGADAYSALLAGTGVSSLPAVIARPAKHCFGPGKHPPSGTCSHGVLAGHQFGCLIGTIGPSQALEGLLSCEAIQSCGSGLCRPQRQAPWVQGLGSRVRIYPEPCSLPVYELRLITQKADQPCSQSLAPHLQRMQAS